MFNLIIVKHQGSNHFISVPDNAKEHADKLAFRFIYGRREKDYQEVYDNTTKVTIKTMSSDVAEVMGRLQ